MKNLIVIFRLVFLDPLFSIFLVSLNASLSCYTQDSIRWIIRYAHGLTVESFAAHRYNLQDTRPKTYEYFPILHNK